MDWFSNIPDVNSMKIIEAKGVQKEPLKYWRVNTSHTHWGWNFSQDTTSNIFYSIYDRIDKLIECNGSSLRYESI